MEKGRYVMFDLSKFDEYIEDNQREVKSAKGGLPNSIWETYSSFANSYGGVIILGVAENKDGSWYTTGLTDERRLIKEFWDGINNKHKVSMNILSDNDVETYKEDKTGDIIVVIHVPRAKREMKPIYLNDDLLGSTFRRNWEGDYRCSVSEVKAMLRDQTEKTMDMKVIETLSIEQLNKETVKNYRNRHRYLNSEHPWNDLGDEQYLQRIGAADIGEDEKLHPTAAGLLMFGDEWRIVREFPEYFLDYQELLDPQIRWTDRIYSSTGDWSGNLFDFYFRVYNRITLDIKIPFQMSGGDRIEETPVHKAIREALANCLINTDYQSPRGVVIRKKSNELILENPGDIRVGKYQMRSGGESDPRNKSLMKMFNLIGIGERAGSGVPQLFEVWKKQGWLAPMIDERFGEAPRTILKLSFEKKATEKSDNKPPTIKTDNKKATINEEGQLQELQANMQVGYDYKIEEICNLTGLKRTRTRDLVKNLVSKGIVTEQGQRRSKRYRLSINAEATEKSDNKSLTIKSDNKKATINEEGQLQELQANMQIGYDYKIEEICNLTGLKRTRTRDLVKILVDKGIVKEQGQRRSKRYKRIK